MSRMQQCPTCGSKLKKENYQKRIKKKRLSRDKITLSLIDDMFESVSLYFPMDDLDRFSFLSDVEEVTDIVVRKMIRQYNQERYYKRGYGIKYLTGMIKNENSAYGLKKEYERKSLDRIPPKVDK
jgi:hypothetical protein